MTLSEQRDELAARIERATGGKDGMHATALGPLALYRFSQPSDPLHTLYEPALCLIARGRKRVLLGGEAYVYDAANYLLASVDLSVVGQVVEATPRAPYLSLRLDLDPGQINALLLESDLPPIAARGGAVPSPEPRGMAVSPLDAPLLDAVLRLVRLLETPGDLPLLAPLVQREILYRLLVGAQGARLRHMAAEDSRARRVVRAIHYLKRHFAEPLRIEDLAREVCMSPSGLHHHFKAVTALSPLQYQKRLRLQEARRLMLSESLDATTASYRVGYDSPSQFSREYRRFFGAPPLRDAARLRRDTDHAALAALAAG